MPYSSSAFLGKEGTFKLNLGMDRYYIENPYGEPLYHFFRFPIYFDYNIIKNVSIQVGLPPTVSVFNIRNNQQIQNAPLYFGGNGYLKFLLAFDDYEYNFKHAISIDYYFSSSSQNFNEIRKTNSTYNTRNFIVNDFYPLIKNSENLSFRLDFF